jgi:hypothetical protein
MTQQDINRELHLVLWELIDRLDGTSNIYWPALFAIKQRMLRLGDAINEDQSVASQ